MRALQSSSQDCWPGFSSPGPGPDNEDEDEDEDEDGDKNEEKYGKG